MSKIIFIVVTYINSDLIARFIREETHLFVLRVMVGLVILYDHVHPVGAFGKSSNMDVRLVVFCLDVLLFVKSTICYLGERLCSRFKRATDSQIGKLAQRIAVTNHFLLCAL